MSESVSVERRSVTIYTDGGADPNPGPGGWGVILSDDRTGVIKELSGGDPHTTNNRMELTAAIHALEALNQPCEVILHTDSRYLQEGITKWIKNWRRQGWKRGKKANQEIENVDLWKRLDVLSEEQSINWLWVKGHAGNVYNERADELATREIRRFYRDAREGLPADEAYLLVSARGGQGIWAVSVRQDGNEELITGLETNVTSNQLYIIAAIQALSTFPMETRVRLYTTSDYLRNGASQWIKGWKRRNWQTKAGDPVKNMDLWQRLDYEVSLRNVEWPSVKDDPDLELTFEDVGRRAEEEIAEQQRSRQDDDWVE